MLDELTHTRRDDTFTVRLMFRSLALSTERCVLLTSLLPPPRLSDEGASALGARAPLGMLHVLGVHAS